MSIDQEGFRWRNDDGSETSATWKAVQDSNISLALDTPARLRIIVDAAGAGQAATRYRLEARLSVSPTSEWFEVTNTGSAKVMLAASANIAAGGENTTAQLTAPAGSPKSFTAGRMWDDESGQDDVTIGNDVYTELEFSVKAVSANGAGAGDVYEFRVTRFGQQPSLSTPLFSDNGDGTATATFTSDIASHSVISVFSDAGRTNLIATVSQQSTYKTSHSELVPASPDTLVDATYYYTVDIFTAGGGAASASGSFTISTASAEALAIFAAFTTPPSAARKTVINTCVTALKNAGIWTKLDSLWVLAAADSQAARIDWKNPSGTALAASGTPTFTADRGYTGNGSDGVLTGPTNYADLTQFTLNAAHLGVWSLTSGQIGSAAMGHAADAVEFIRCRNAADLTTYAINQNSVNTAANTDGSGHFVANRSASNAVQIFREGSSIGTGVTVSASVPANAPTILAGNGGFSTSQIAVAHIGADLNSGTLVADFRTALYNYLHNADVGAV